MEVSHKTHFELTAVRYDYYTVISVADFCLKISINLENLDLYLEATVEPASFDRNRH